MTKPHRHPHSLRCVLCDAASVWFRPLLLALVSISLAATPPATTRPRSSSSSSRGNTDESKIPPYTLIDPLTTLAGQKITTPDDWLNIRRPELVKLFEDNQFGKCPPKPDNESFIVFDDDQQALDSKAIRKQVMITFGKTPSGAEGPKLHMLIYLPPAASQKPPNTRTIGIAYRAYPFTDS